MKKTIIIKWLCIFAILNLARANETRMQALMAGDYIDDLTNISSFPHHIALYANNLYGDITPDLENYGFIFSPDTKYGAFAFWQPSVPVDRFNLGYGINLYQFDIGVLISPVKNHTHFGFGIGRTYFNRRIDLSFLMTDELNNTCYQFSARLSKRVGDIIIVPKYRLDYFSEPYQYTNHRIGLMLQRLILNEGFVFFIAEYDFGRGNIDYDYTNVYAGLELPLSRIVVLRLGAYEQFTNSFESPSWQLEPGIGLQIREFNIDFHLNKEWFFNKDKTLFKSFGLDLNFGRF